MPETVEPRTSRGLRDLLSDQMLARQWMIETIRNVYELYGFVPLSTPAIEFLDVLRGSEAGQEAQQSIFTVQNPENEALGLRFDLTVPLARVVAQYRELPRPFRRYQVAPVWRADKPDKGRFREFTQFDLDSVGVESEIADTEIMAGMCDTLRALKVGPFRVRFSSRGILNALLAFAGIPQERSADVFRVLDKLDKVGPAKVRLELTTGYVDASGDPIRGLGLENAQVDKIERFLQIPATDRRATLDELRATFSGVEGAADELAKIERISNHLYSLGYADAEVSLDVSIARGLAYYTGPVFEANLLDALGQACVSLDAFAASDAKAARAVIERLLLSREGKHVITPWRHLMYAYLIENTRAYEILAKVVQGSLTDEPFGALSDTSFRWLRLTEDLFFRDGVSSLITSITSTLRPDIRATRRNAYQRLFGIDLNHGAPDGGGRNLMMSQNAHEPLSPLGQHYLGGILQNAAEGTVFSTPTANPLSKPMFRCSA